MYWSESQQGDRAQINRKVNLVQALQFGVKVAALAALFVRMG